MPTAVIEPPTTEEQLREQAEQLREDVDEALGHGGQFDAVIEGAREFEAAIEAQTGQRVQEREAWFAELQRLIRSVTRSQIWQAHDLARELLITLDDLTAAIEQDPDAEDPEWQQRAALMRMRVVLEAMVRQLEHHAIDRPEVAAQFVAVTLSDVGDTAVGRLLGTTARMVGKYRSDGVQQVRKDPDRVTLVGQLVYELKTARTPRGVQLWFEAAREALGGRTPLQLIDEDVARAGEVLIPLARGGRAQLDIAGSGALE